MATVSHHDDTDRSEVRFPSQTVVKRAGGGVIAERLGYAMDELARSIEMHRVDAVELPQHLLVPGVWVEGGTTEPLAKKSANSARKKSN